VIAGILWVGAAITYLFFIKPSVKSIGMAGPQFMQYMSGRRKYPVFMMTTSLLTVISGVFLFWFTSGKLNPVWITSGVGLGFSIGSVIALGAFLIGAFGIGPTAGRVGVLGGQIAASSQGPAPEQIERIHFLEKKLSRLENIEFVMLVIALATMGTARYWFFNSYL
jgi:hypothetical protein